MTVVATVCCPRCGTSIESAEDASIRECTGCEGVLLNRRVLLRLLTVVADDLQDSGEFGQAQPDVPDDVAKVPVGDCPQCAGPMESFGYLGSKDLVIDSCASCDLVWTDCNELTMMAMRHAQSMQTNEEVQEACRKSDNADRELRMRIKIRRRVRRVIF